MTSDIFRSWFLNCFLKEVEPIVDPDMQIQFLIDNCSAHNDPDLHILDPSVSIKFLPPNTTSLIQPMDQAVLACVKSYQKRRFYHKLFISCENNPDKTSAVKFKDFLKEYTILEAINDIAEGWKQVPASTIQKSFRKVFPQEKWDELTGGNTDEVTDVAFDLEGFQNNEPDQLG